MGSLLLAAGEAGMRFALPNARIMVHQPSGGYQGQVTDILIHAREVEGLKRRLNEIYEKHTGKDYKAIEEALERDNFMTAEGAKAFGIVDQVMEKRPSRRPEQLRDRALPRLHLGTARTRSPFQPCVVPFHRACSLLIPTRHHVCICEHGDESATGFLPRGIFTGKGPLKRYRFLGSRPIT